MIVGFAEVLQPGTLGYKVFTRLIIGLWCLVVLGRALGDFIFSLIGLKRILFTNIVQRL